VALWGAFAACCGANASPANELPDGAVSSVAALSISIPDAHTENNLFLHMQSRRLISHTDAVCRAA
jgi:hypothetical protein